MSIRGLVKDYPASVTAATVIGVLVHRIFYRRVHFFPDVPGRMASFTDAWQIYIGFAAVVAISAGFTGVVIVFALSNDTDRFRRLRLRGGDRLFANWLSPVLISLMAAFGATVSAVLHAVDYGMPAWWLFESLVLLSLFSAFRLLWLLGELIRLVHLDDVERQRRIEAQTVSLHQLIPPQTASGS